ncbi:molybdate ABC transporter substrate-binding protein [Hydrogenimonas urashimensis]|uniref:molybdate ABC transporter substrate-binding protein n=1 Tax=Hydrogenimonas urashimensis TaxID=2740515 RepID=UPI001915236B|nr:molybdate ABC transporter substrate-binding protein [Hydrogenimonas urashimensis]
MKILLALLFALFTLHASQITVAVAANVSYALDDLKAAFSRKHPDIRLRTILGSSGKLTAQIRNGAPFQIFMSADMGFPESLYEQKIAITKPKVYARGILALFSPRPHDFSEGLSLLESPAIRRIAVANPNTAPYGKAAVEALKKSALYERVKPKIIFAESISQTVAYTMTAADIGMIAKSSLFSPKMRRFKEGRHWMTVDPSLYTPIDQGIVLLKNAKKNKACRIFYDFILSPEARAIFKKYGYILP